jgi:hypothetical protein
MRRKERSGPGMAIVTASGDCAGVRRDGEASGSVVLRATGTKYEDAHKNAAKRAEIKKERFIVQALSESSSDELT